jgi:isoleucyl-tRNA synthetase
VPEKDYKATLKLPKTDFPMKANLPKREPDILRRWDEMKLYDRVMTARSGAVRWILHDGPPYANGPVHLGTALNKIFKDFVVRSRSMMGFRAPFVPGWDCHGMPIEHKVSREIGESVRTMPKIELRALCRAEAEKWIDIQRRDFRRLGAIGDWDHPYLTMAPDYDAAEVGVLRAMVERGFVYRGKRPVHWCFECRTALAEAEVEYTDHVSPSIYVAFAINANVGDAGALAATPEDANELQQAHRDGRMFAVIWTTTPWTIPANLGICVNETFDYVALKVGENYYIVADRLAAAVEKDCSFVAEKRIPISRAALKTLDGRDIFRHPIANRDGRLMFANHVTADSGTGLVHTAPGHGYEDFVVGAQYGLAPFTPVDNAGVFTDEAGEWAGRNVIAANYAIVEKIKAAGALLHVQKYSHSYPHCWRCHSPLIFRATEQWFISIDHDDLRAKLIDAIDNVKWFPAWSRDRIRNMTTTRPDWTISRQRAWGVPIPAMRCRSCGDVSLEPAVMKRAEEIFAREGSDAWWSHPAEDFIAAGVKCAKCGGESFDKEDDVLDVWFDSGSSQAAVLGRREELGFPADAYLEAVEQARGWFGSSLVCAVAERGQAPFRSVISHGLTVDEKGRKMSKSLGNSPDAADVVNQIGADVLRLVYASLDTSTEIALGATIYTATAESYRKIRNTARFVLGNLADFDPARDLVEYARMLEFDRFILTRLEKLKADVLGGFEKFDFQASYQALLSFVVVDLSSLYIDVARDRLYCAGAASIDRRSAQSALWHILDTLIRMLAVFIPFTAEEIYDHFPGRREESVHLLTLNLPINAWHDIDLESRWSRVLVLRDDVLKLLETMRQAGAIGAPLDAAIEIGVRNGAGMREGLEKHRAGLKELFIVSNLAILDEHSSAQLGKAEGAANGVFVREGERDGFIVAGRHAPGVKCARCWCYFDDGGDADLCARCREVVRA